MHMAGGKISFEEFANVVVGIDWAAQLPTGCALYDEWQVAPAEGDIVHAGVGTRPVTAQYCRWSLWHNCNDRSQSIKENSVILLELL